MEFSLNEHHFHFQENREMRRIIATYLPIRQENDSEICEIIRLNGMKNGNWREFTK